MLVSFKDDNPKSTENTGFQAGSDSTPMAMHKKHAPVRFFDKAQNDNGRNELCYII